MINQVLFILLLSKVGIQAVKVEEKVCGLFKHKANNTVAKHFAAFRYAPTSSKQEVTLKACKEHSDDNSFEFDKSFNFTSIGFQRKDDDILAFVKSNVVEVINNKVKHRKRVGGSRNSGLEIQSSTSKDYTTLKWNLYMSGNPLTIFKNEQILLRVTIRGNVTGSEEILIQPGWTSLKLRKNVSTHYWVKVDEVDNIPPQRIKIQGKDAKISGKIVVTSVFCSIIIWRKQVVDGTGCRATEANGRVFCNCRAARKLFTVNFVYIFLIMAILLVFSIIIYLFTSLGRKKKKVNELSSDRFLYILCNHKTVSVIFKSKVSHTLAMLFPPRRLCIST